MLTRDTMINLSDLTDLLSELGFSDPLPNPITYQYYKNLQQRKIIINEEIGSGLVETAMIPLLEMDNDGTGEPIEIILNTPGGSVFDSMTLCNIIDQLKTPTTITVLTYAYSMGSILLMAGYNNPNVKKRCYDFSTALLHSGSSYLQGASFSVKDFFNFNTKFEDMIKDYTLSHSKITDEEYTRMERCEWYMTSNDMLEKGLVDEILR